MSDLGKARARTAEFDEEREAKRKLEQWAQQTVLHRRKLLNRIEQQAQLCIDSPNSSKRQRDYAQECLGYHRAMRRSHFDGDIDLLVYQSIMLGMAYQRIGREALLEPAKYSRDQMGTCWRGRWLPLRGKERAMLDCLTESLKMETHRLVKKVWGESYNPKKRNKYDQVRHQLQKRLTEAGISVKIVFGNDYVRITETETPS